MATLKLVCCVFLLFVGAAVGTFPLSACGTLIPKSICWDFIVVGAGTAGSVVSSRLVSETNQTVLLLEGGAWGSGQRAVGGTDYVMADFEKDPITGESRLGKPLTRYDVPLMSDTIRAAAGTLKNMWPIKANGTFYAQAKVIGGNQATNGMAWFATQRADFDGWELPGYSSTEMWYYAKKIENATSTGFLNSPDRGYSGRMHITNAPAWQLEQNRFMQAVMAAGYPGGGDMNTGNLTEGVYQAQSSIRDGIRQSTSVTYLAPVMQNKNLSFRPGSTVTRVIFNSNNRAIGVEYVDADNITRRSYASKEVVLTAGSLQTTKILYHSGIGPRSILDAFKIPHRVVNDMIGQRIRNQQRIPMIYEDKTILNPNYFAIQPSSLQYADSGMGFLQGRGFVFWHYHTEPVDPKYPYPDSQASPNPYVPGPTMADVFAQKFMMLVSLNHNKYNHGKLNLTSSDVHAPTAFVANLFADQSDVERGVRAMLKLRKLMKDHWNGSAVEISPGPDFDTPEELIPWIRHNALSFCHYYATTPMGTAKDAPCDPRMRLRGVTGLRIVGPSSIPEKPTYPGLQQLATLLGEKGTDLILEDHNL